ncbi:MAG: MmgE/PrpD family protein, partial [Alphaproteobacteria bacterium]
TVVDPRAEAAYPQNMAGVARVRTKTDAFEAFVEIPKGEPDNFLSRDELLEKFNDLCGPYMTSAAAGRLAAGILSLDAANHVSSVLNFD